jgi:hypothetical protein
LQNASDDGLVHLKNLVNLESLSLFSNPVRGSGLEHLAGLKKLRRLNLSFTGVHDKDLLHLKGLTALEELELVYVFVTEEGVAELAKGLPRLRVIGSPASRDVVLDEGDGV